MNTNIQHSVHSLA